MSCYPTGASVAWRGAAPPLDVLCMQQWFGRERRAGMVESVQHGVVIGSDQLLLHASQRREASVHYKNRLRQKQIAYRHGREGQGSQGRPRNHPH